MPERSVPVAGPAPQPHRRLRHAAPGFLALGLVVGCGGTATPSPTPAPSASPVASPTTESNPVTPSPATPSPTASIPAGPSSDPATWPLAWSDEFDGPAGTPPDPATWGHDLGGGGWGNNELQFYTTNTANAAHDGDGHLVITALESDGSLACHYGPCAYTSARLLTRDRLEIHYGRIEARIRVPEGFGLWPAFWMLGSDIDAVSWPASGEIDVMEYVGRRPNEVLGTIHGPGYSGGSGITGSIDLGEPVAAAFHEFALEWRPEGFAWFVDGVRYHEVARSEVAPNAWVFDHPFFLLLNVAVGGNLGGPVFPDTIFPASMAVDYVRVYQEATP